MTKRIDFQRDPDTYRHWTVAYDGPVAWLTMDVDEEGGLFDGYLLKLNSYDLGVDIELNDIVQRMRFEHPEVKVVVMRSGKEKVFCAGANIRMLGGAAHSHKVNFCKFTNETRNGYEAAEAESGQKYIAAVKGSCAGGGYELALACNHIMLTDDSAAYSSNPGLGGSYDNVYASNRHRLGQMGCRRNRKVAGIVPEPSFLVPSIRNMKTTVQGTG